jgi:hypothetical protein
VGLTAQCRKSVVGPKAQKPKIVKRHFTGIRLEQFVPHLESCVIESHDIGERP